MTADNLFCKAFEAMPDQFTGDMFVAKLKDLGMKPKSIKYYEKRRTMFYRNNTIKVNRRTYEKKNLFNQDNSKSELEKAIKLIKSHGLKVLKPVTEFKEI